MILLRSVIPKTVLDPTMAPGENTPPPCAWWSVYFANEAGIPDEKTWMDGIFTRVNIQQPQVISLMAP
jgi:hypothetical protein